MTYASGFRWAICKTLPKGSRTIARGTRYAVSRGPFQGRSPRSDCSLKLSTEYPVRRGRESILDHVEARSFLLADEEIAWLSHGDDD